MNRFLLTFAAVATVLATGSLVPSRVDASPLSASIGADLAIEALAPIQNVAFCFYVDGWNGPGLYQCGFQRRQGMGWHGPRGGQDHRGRVVDHDRRGHQSNGPGIHIQTEGRGGRY
ncbi:MAG: hypothetical protein WBW74_11720 [Xanthobacteraceae bacterium]